MVSSSARSFFVNVTLYFIIASSLLKKQYNIILRHYKLDLTLGQGERVPMGHSDTVIPFACGMSVQGLIVMETLAWLEWAKNNPLVDKSRLAAIGNSGGGTLT